MHKRSKVLPSGTWLLIAAAPLMGLALLAAVGATYRGVQAASETITRGQLDVVQDALRFSARNVPGPAQVDLEALLKTYAEDGLRYLAIVGDDDEVVAHAGVPTPRGPTPSALEHEEMATVGQRVRAVFRVYGHSGDAGARWSTRLMLELEPQAATALKREAQLTLGVGALAALTLLVLAFVSIRWSLRRQKLERTLENERRLASLGEMSAVLAHEIRNPLASLKGNAQLLARGLPLDEPTRKKADRVVDEATRLEKLVNDLLDLARSERLNRTPCDPMLPVKEVVGKVGEVTVDDSRAPPLWSLDAERLRQVLTNLLTNAHQASNDVVQVRVYQHHQHLVYEVQDRGPGIPEADRERIFEAFFTRRTRGTGLGLAVSRRLVEMHGGTIEAANVPGGGALFRISIPQLP